MSFSFVGRLPSSKSILNRLLLVQSYDRNLVIAGDSQCDDVNVMREAIRAFESGTEIPVGAAGTVLRFMALRASRRSGRHVLKGHARLFARPQTELVKVLRQVGASAELHSDRMEIESSGWHLQGDTLVVPSDRSSQFASSVLLNSWGLPFELYVSRGRSVVSEGYWRMSVRLAQQLGLKIDFWDADFRVPRDQKVQAQTFTAEIDVSSAFALAAIAALSGSATFLDFPENSLQPDAGFVDVLQAMGVPLKRGEKSLRVERASRLNGVAVNLRSMPDLFPVLSVLCALAEGESVLYGAPHLVHKESDRLNQMAELIRKLGREVEVLEDGLKIRGPRIEARKELTMDSDHDHRLAFAGAVLRAAGHNVTILNPQVVTKSFPEFWQIVGAP